MCQSRVRKPPKGGLLKRGVPEKLGAPKGRLL